MGFTSTANERRPQDFRDLQGQSFVVTTIANAIKNGTFAHAYLFAGPRGVGKTTSARLLAKSLNCEKGPAVHPCGECASCRDIPKSASLDCIEIDGASNTSVDDIRRIKNDIMYPPSSRFKIYIIDEIHMLSTSAFNALLKTIEEPPEYVIFIFATTELQKVPQTIRSRCQFFKFKAISPEDTLKVIKATCGEKGVSIDDESLLWLAREAGGSLRDAYMLYDQLTSFCGKNITFDRIQKELLLTDKSAIEDIFASALDGDAASCVSRWLDLCENGVSPEQFVEDFALYLRAVLLYKCSVRSETVLFYSPSAFEGGAIASLDVEKAEMALSELLDLYRNIRYSVNPRFEIELYLARLASLRDRAGTIRICRRLKELHDEISSAASGESAKGYGADATVKVRESAAKTDSGSARTADGDETEVLAADAGNDVRQGFAKSAKQDSDSESSDMNKMMMDVFMDTII